MKPRINTKKWNTDDTDNTDDRGKKLNTEDTENEYPMLNTYFPKKAWNLVRKYLVSACQ